MEKAESILQILKNLISLFNGVVQHLIIPKHADKFPFLKPIVILLLEDMYRFYNNLSKVCDHVKKVIFKLESQPEMLYKYYSFYQKFLISIKSIKKLDFIHI